MPKFIDYHPQMPQMPPETVGQMKEMIESGAPNSFGATALNIFMGADGSGYCLSEGPDAESIIKSHDAGGVPLDKDHITEVNSLV
ncbi:MAG: DUF4242 domain-containing protein [SAR202 cluster bacterium]|jgi:ethanolamine utilization protein EutA (predicted chaperonin)|nr:DUF4242 domain-containing protein [SAR202 cluster bacterium]PCH86147.1 MAG: hypothetical protein COB86_09030 [Dehalococcoidia bacterium]